MTPTKGMASKLTFWDLYSDRLPKVDRCDPETHVPVFISSVQKADMNLCIHLNVIRESPEAHAATLWAARIKQVLFPLSFAGLSEEDCQRLRLPGVVYPNDAITTLQENLLAHSQNVFNGDTKEYVDSTQTVAFYNTNDFKSAKKLLESRRATVLSFVRNNQLHDTNAIALLNRIALRCYGLAKHLVGAEVIELTDLVMCDLLDTATLSCNHPDVYKTPYVEAAFDIECLIKHESSSNYLPQKPEAYRSNAYNTFVRLRNRHADLKLFCKAAELNLPPMPLTMLDPGEITSISLVKKTTKPKKRMVFYNAALTKTTPLSLAEDRVEFVSCADEYHLLLQFLTQLKEVNILYVFNAEFDVGLVWARLQYWKGKVSPRDAEALHKAWSDFTCKYKNPLPLTLQFASEYLFSHYDTLLSALESAKKLCWNEKEQSMARVLEDNHYMSLRKRIVAYNDNSKKYPHLTFNCFGAHIIDLYRVCYSYDINFHCSARSLDAISAFLIPKSFPKKHSSKCRKMADVKYTEMDDMFTCGDPAALRRYLLYNLVDSELLMRLAKTQDVVSNFLNRTRVSMNVDCVNTGRADMYFCGFVQATKLAAMPLLNARVLNNIMCAQEWQAESKCFPDQFKPDCPVRPKLDGGYVVAPITGLSFAGVLTSVELTLDFSSLYPSNMVDCAISPDAIIDETHASRFQGWVLFDWKKIDGRLKCYTLMYEPSGRRHPTITTSSLHNYLSMRKHYKGLMAKTTDPKEKSFYNKMQTEMKLAANSHYGVAPEASKHLITALGRYKIKSVIGYLEESGHLVNYGDTDSVMCHLPQEDALLYTADDDTEDSPLPLEEWTEGRLNSIRHCVRQQFEHFAPTLEDIDRRLTDAMIDCLCFVNEEGSVVPIRKTEDMLTIVGEEFRESCISKLCFEVYSSIITRLNKKMYICTAHEPEGDDPFGHTAIKMKGLVANKSSSSGAARRITDVYVNLICKGHALRVVKDFDHLQCTPWHRLKAGDVVKLGQSDSPVVEVRVVKEAAFGYLGVEVKFAESTLRFITTSEGINLTHMISRAEQRRRCQTYTSYAIYESFANNAGFNSDWQNTVKYIKPSSPYSANLKINRALVGLDVPSEGKMPYVDLVPAPNDVYNKTICAAKSKDANKRFIHQDCAAAFLGRFYVDMDLKFIPYMFGATTNTNNVDNVVRNAKNMRPHTANSRSWIKMNTHKEVMGKPVSNFLVHVILEECCHMSCTPTPKEQKDFSVSAKEACKSVRDQMELMAAKGSHYFSSFFKEMPKDMGGVLGHINRLNFTITFTLPKNIYGDFNPSRDLNLYVDMLQALGRLLELKLVEPQSSPKGPRISVYLGTNPKLKLQILTDLGLGPSCKELCVVTKSTDHPDIITAARLIYLYHIFHPGGSAPQQEVEKPQCLSEPPAKATATELKSWVSRHGDLIEEWSSEQTEHSRKVRIHCSGCITYWTKGKDVTKIATDDYMRDGALYVRKRKNICLNTIEDEA
ncbi:ORF110 [Ranid herpesvirus 2]|uniref:DNA polymerase n=1 Tax=Ranid herpesvirus 2 TaxID=389214 RepID=Q14VZ6_9VIRU|nr:ORF110 [Ranid herpesvirus 2]ABG25576.1 ORF110 [Ranid herpesvirus 2]